MSKEPETTGQERGLVSGFSAIRRLQHPNQGRTKQRNAYLSQNRKLPPLKGSAAGCFWRSNVTDVLNKMLKYNN